MFTITVEAESRDRYGNPFTGVSICVKKDGEVDDVLVFVGTDAREELTEETDREDIREAMEEIIDQAKEIWWLEDDEVEELKAELLKY